MICNWSFKSRDCLSKLLFASFCVCLSNSTMVKFYNVRVLYNAHPYLHWIESGTECVYTSICWMYALQYLTMRCYFTKFYFHHGDTKKKKEEGRKVEEWKEKSHCLSICWTCVQYVISASAFDSYFIWSWQSFAHLYDTVVFISVSISISIYANQVE